MKILITGAGTLIGNAISLHLSKYFNILSTYRHSYPKNLKKIHNINIKKIDLDKKISFKTNFNFVVHCASAIPDYNFSKDKLKKTNVIGFKKLLKSINKKTVKKIILLSSLSVYGKINHKKVNEKTPICNPNFYGKTKLTMEKELIKFAKKENINYVILRLPGVVGINSQHNFLSKLILSIKKNPAEINITNPDLRFNNLLHVKNLCRLIHYIILRPKISGIFVLGSKYPVKIKNLLKNINKFKKIKFNYQNNFNGFSLDIQKSIKYKFPLDSTNKMFSLFLNENLKK
jgi:nucleoside-diphosphate-sugar epimerase